MSQFFIRGESITLAQACKAVGLAQSGGQAKRLVKEGMARVNDKIETHPGRQLVVGDRFGTIDAGYWVIASEEPSKTEDA